MSPVQRPNDDLVEPLFAGLRGSGDDPDNRAGTDLKCAAEPERAFGKRWMLVASAVAVLLLALMARSLLGGEESARGTEQPELTPAVTTEGSESAGS